MSLLPGTKKILIAWCAWKAPDGSGGCDFITAAPADAERGRLIACPACGRSAGTRTAAVFQAVVTTSVAAALASPIGGEA